MADEPGQIAILPPLMTAVSDMTLTSNRLACLREGLAERGVSSLLVTGEQDVRYLAGCFGHDTRLLVTPTRAILISDRRYEEYLAPWAEDGSFEVAIHNRPAQMEHIAHVLAGEALHELGIQSAHMTIEASGGLEKQLGDITLVPLSGLLASLRICKSPDEVETIERAIGIQIAALHATLPTVRIGMSEGQVAARLVYEMRMRGAESESFEPIVGSGANASVIHHVPGGDPIVPGVLLIDWGARVDGLCSDLTRTFFLGEPDDEMKRIYTVVAEANRAAIDACAVGTMTGDVDAAAREVITAAGYAEQFAHGVGHGLGRDVHEQPSLGPAGKSVPLEAGMVVTIEPGIYVPGVGGVRIEDDILVTDDGPRVLSEHLDSSLSGAILAVPQEGTA
ncbi:MAG: Xaa-Pro peptidase family protein [Phycisphaerales bacterium]|nr:Xaa-Pro peptidase family protein [Phycisphaerales bacterium]